MIWAVINNILSSICKIFYKKAVSLATLPPLLFSRFGEAIGFVLALVMIVVFGFETSVLSWAVVIGITVLIVINLASSACNQKLYRIEKLSNIIPYQNLKSVFSIIAGFLIFKDASLFSFVIAVISFLVILGFSLDFKNLKLPKSI
jgi:drug/metabolite transporter (DMT)-like permease